MPTMNGMGKYRTVFFLFWSLKIRPFLAIDSRRCARIEGSELRRMRNLVNAFRLHSHSKEHLGFCLTPKSCLKILNSEPLGVAG